MERQSIARQSFFPGASQTLNLSDLKACVALTEECTRTLTEGVERLAEETVELERLSKVLDVNRLYLLVPERRVRKAAAQLTDSVEPQITELIELAEKSLKQLERRESGLRAKIDTAQAHKQNMAPASRNDERRIKMLQAQRQRLTQELMSLERECETLERLNEQ